jgi:site-specific recombinase XerD
VSRSDIFDVLFHYPGVLARHRHGPAAQARERYLTHCADQGAARETLLRTARELLAIAQRLDPTTDRLISLQEAEAAAGRWSRHQQRRGRIGGPKGSRHYFLQMALSWLRFLGRLEAREPQAPPFAGRLEHFAACMREQRGLSEHTIRHRCWYARQFLAWLTGRNRSLAELTLPEVDAFLRLKAAQGWGRVSLATAAQALRAFFRHAEAQSWCAQGFAAGIQGPRVFKQEGLPVGPSWPDVERLLAATDGQHPRQIRDHAILLLFALYAFRSGEVAVLRLDDLHWEREVIAVARPKQRRAQEYPLVPMAGEAILRYLQQVRPRCGRRELFLSLTAPFRPLSAGAFYHLVSSRLYQLNIPSLRHGPHALRHACAGHLLAEGFSLKAIGDHLGHRSAYATRTYAKVDLAGLRAVADFDLGGLV